MSLTSSIPVLRVSDYARARAFWTGPLGFAPITEAGDPAVGFGIFERGAAAVMLTAWDGPGAAYAGWRAYFHTDDLAPLVDALRAAGAAFRGPQVAPYGLTEIEVADPDGNTVCFGEGRL